MAHIGDIAIIGPGKVGTAIGVLATRAGLRVAAVAGRKNADTAAAAIDPDVRACTPPEAAAAGKLVLLTVPDEAIEKVCGELAAASAFAEGSIVAHCSGALSSEILGAARSCCACQVGSMHPMQTFPTVEAAVAKLPGAYCFCEGDHQAVTVLERLARAIGAKPVRMDPAGKVLYHAAAVMACNYVTALLDAAVTVFGKAGIKSESAAAAIAPMVLATVENVAAMGPAEALTGPIARGDQAVVRRHLEALGRCDDELPDLYKALGRRTVDLALRKGTIDHAKADALRKLLDGPNK